LKDKRGWLALFLTLALVRGLLYAVATPPWQAPDENGHFEYAWLIAHLERVPTREDISPTFERELLGSLYEWRYGELIGRPLPEQMPDRVDDLPAQIFARRCRTVLMERFSLSYLWQALFLRPFRYQDLVFQLYAARFSSVLLNIATVWLAWCIFSELLPQRRGLAVAMTAFVLFLPQHTFINASVGEGPLAELAACVVLYGWLRLFHRGARAGDVAAVLGGTLVGVWAKKTAVFLLPFDVLALALFLGARFRISTRRRRLVYLTLLGAVLFVFLVWLTLQMPAGRLMRGLVQSWWSNPQLYLGNEWISLDQALKGTFDSFWAMFGWMAVGPDPGWYTLIYILTIGAVEGWLLPRSNLWSVSSPAKRLLGMMLLLAFAIWLAFVIGTSTGLTYYQGRYLFPAAVPAAFFLVMGWARWTPERWQRYFAPGVVILLATLDAVAFCTAIWPFFYGR